VDVQEDLDTEKFYREFMALMAGPTPGETRANLNR
jgi:hypothetical protein